MGRCFEKAYQRLYGRPALMTTVASLGSGSEVAAATATPPRAVGTAVRDVVELLAVPRLLPAGTQLTVRGQITHRRKLAKDLLFIDLRQVPTTGAATAQPPGDRCQAQLTGGGGSGEPEPEPAALSGAMLGGSGGGSPEGSALGGTVEVVISGRGNGGDWPPVDAAALELGRSLRQGDVVEVAGVLEAMAGPPHRHIAAASQQQEGAGPAGEADVAGQGQQRVGGDDVAGAVVVRAGAGPVGGPGAGCAVRVISRWVDTHGKLSFASASDPSYMMSQRSKSKQGRKQGRMKGDGTLAAASDRRRRPGAKKRLHERRLEQCRGVVQRVATPANAERLAYSPSLCCLPCPSTSVPPPPMPPTQPHSVTTVTSRPPLLSPASPSPPPTAEPAQADNARRRGPAEAGEADDPAPEGRIDWSAMPASLDPAAGEQEGGIISGGDSRGRDQSRRAQRKRWQVESVYCVARALVWALCAARRRWQRRRRPDDDCGGDDDGRGSQLLRVVDFGSGAGNATLAVAWLLRSRCRFVLLDMKPVATELATRRIAQVEGLSQTVSACTGRIEEYREVRVRACV
eukprot:COSAG01_NODE_4482_length_4984_cov_4.097851_1_plen_571_part_00